MAVGLIATACSKDDDKASELTFNGASTDATYTVDGSSAEATTGNGEFSVSTGSDGYVIYVYDDNDKSEYYIRIDNAQASSQDGITSISSPSGQSYQAAHLLKGQEADGVSVSNIVFNYWENEKRAALKLTAAGATYNFKGGFDVSKAPKTWKQSRYVNPQPMLGVGADMTFTQNGKASNKVDVKVTLGTMEDGTILLYSHYVTKSSTYSTTRENFIELEGAIVSEADGIYTLTTDAPKYVPRVFYNGRENQSGSENMYKTQIVYNSQTKQISVNYIQGASEKGGSAIAITGQWNTSGSPLTTIEPQYKE